MVTYGVANGGRRVEVFAREPDGPWSWLGPLDWWFLHEVNGEFVRVQDADGVLTVERYR